MLDDLAPIALIEVGDGGPPQHARLRRAQARAVRDDCLGSLPGAALIAPALDAAARRWLQRARSAYIGDIAEIAATLGFSGIWLLNASYQLGCTALAREEDGAPWLARTLDWPYPGLGRFADVLRAAAPAGDYFSVTWPGYAGVLTAMAPGRFAAAINQAPMWRRTRQPWLRPYDLAANALNTWRTVRESPPDQLLREAFEQCATYAEAKAMLETTPVARPVIYLLIGCAAGERCVIERTETGFETHENDTCAANDWVEQRPHWEARIAADHFLTTPPEAAAARCRARRDALSHWPEPLSRPGFGWVKPPVLNPYTRLAVTMSSAHGVLRVAGFATRAGGLPVKATQFPAI